MSATHLCINCRADEQVEGGLCVTCNRRIWGRS